VVSGPTVEDALQFEEGFTSMINPEERDIESSLAYM